MKRILCFSILVLCFSFAFGQRWLWGTTGVNTSDSWGLGIDSKANAYLTGSFPDTITFGPFHLTSPHYDAYIVKYDINGNPQMALQSNAINSNSWCEGTNVVCDKSDNIIVVGEFGDTVKIGTDTLKSNVRGVSDIFLAKYDRNGNFLWAKQNTHPPALQSFDAGYAVATDKSNSIYITGYYTDTTSFGPFTFNSVAYNNVFLVKYDSNGNVLWGQSSNSPSINNGGGGEGLTVDDSGNVYITGFFYDTISFGALTLISVATPGNGGDAFLAKYDKNGNLKWAWQTHGNDSSFCQGYSILTDASENVYLTGMLTDSVYFGTYLLKGNGTILNDYSDIFLAKFRSNGSIMWAKQSNSTNGGFGGYCLIKDTLNSPYFSAGGYTNGRAGHVIFGNDTFQFPISSADPSFIMKLDTSGNVLCSSMIASGGDDLNSIVCDPSGTYIYLSGDLLAEVVFNLAEVVFNNDTINPKVGEQPFIARWMQCDCAHGKIIIQSPDTVCSSAGNIEVFTSPPGGVLYGSAVYSNFFYPDSAKIGQYNFLYYDFVDSNGCVGHIADSIYVRTCTGVSTLNKNNQFICSPNPSTGIFNIAFVGVQSIAPATIEVFNVYGQIVGAKNFSPAQHATIDLSSQPNGVYFYRVIEDDGSAMGNGKIVIQQ